MNEKEESIIAPPSKLSLNLAELWQYRELFYFFTLRDVKVKYKQTVLGIFWAILQPIFLMMIFSFFFGRALKVETNNIPYPLFVFSGLLLWNLFSSSITNAGNSMVTNANMIKKVYFPRIIIPISSILGSFVDFCFALIVFAGLLIWYAPHIYPGLALLCWPAGIILSCIASFGPGCLLAALNIKYRDFRYVIPFIIQALLFLTPVIYPITILPSKWMQVILALNPMYAAIEIFRAPISGIVNNPDMVLISVGSGFTFFLIGIFYFKKTEHYFADIA